ncbi:uncharacterized protein EDB93DRAFT_141869 [Suillus bovinus]|uniref:uncharacterized protein n=1 Tax=Suillus bovinus TaxID=48563 RepID=UPI001B874D86|nr:uncharacterized protein EDB93DRAFT_141869 [Suillus bovinus]KAG2129185.1 hypothetical protein EDB93DRAFT_141869 [Suillus bovinus]
MFVRIFTISVISLLLSQVYAMAAVDTTSSSSPISCDDDGELHCCMKDSSKLGDVDDEQCQNYSENCSSGYVPSCCYIVTDLENYYYCQVIQYSV